MARAAVRGRLTWQRAEVLAVTPETARARRISLRVPDWPGHVPGQHLDLRLTAEDGYTAQRSYSIASAPEADGVDLVVELLEGGEVSGYLVGELRAGDELEVRGPLGGWFVWSDALGGPLQLVAGGSGIVPFLAMLDHHRAVASSVPVRLLCSVRTAADLIGGDRLSASAAQVTVTVTRTPPPGWTGPTGRVDVALLRAHVLPPGERPQVFVCGPTGFVEAVAAGLVELGHDPARVKTERFGSTGGLP